MLPYFKRAEDNERGESTYHGVGGPLTVSDGRSMHPLVGACIDAAVEAGIEATTTSTARRRKAPAGTRSRNATASAAAPRGAISTRRRAVATSTWSPMPWRRGSSSRAVARSASRCFETDELETVHAEREVILSAGAYQSPQLLLLSGSGRRTSCRALGIEPRADLPVGREPPGPPHRRCRVGHRPRRPRRTAMTPENVELFEREGRGPLTSSFAEAGAFIRTRPELDAPDIQFHCRRPVPRAEARSTRRPEHDGYVIAPTLIKPTQPRAGDAAQRAAARQAADPAQLPDDRGGRRTHDRRHSRRARDRLAAGAWKLRTGRLGRARSDSDADIVRLRRGNSARRLPPGRNMRDGRRSSTQSCASTASRVCASWTRR